MDAEQIQHMLINPYYAINIEPDMVSEHEPVIPEATWVQANMRLIDEIGSKEWLERLLTVLQGDYPRNPDEIVPLYDAPTED
jgi:hypothetical protein